jgi:altronate dehydratase
MPNALVLNDRDDVAVALRPIRAGELVQLAAGLTFKANQDIPFAHKVALKARASGQPIHKYGEVIGSAVQDIATGDHVHVHNIRSIRNQVKK